MVFLCIQFHPHPIKLRFKEQKHAVPAIHLSSKTVPEIIAQQSQSINTRGSLPILAKACDCPLRAIVTSLAVT